MSEEVINEKIKSKKKQEKAEDFIGRTFNYGKLKVIGVAGKQGKNTTFKVTCTECSKDPELFPDGYFVAQKFDLINGHKPCGCSKKPEWKGWQFLILALRAGEKKGFVVHGFAEEFHGQHTKLNLECIKDGHKWTASINSVINTGRGCPKCVGTLKLTYSEALYRCEYICKEMDYESIGFQNGYNNVKSIFEYICPKHGKQKVTYSHFVNNGSRCPFCFKEKQKEYGNLYGYYPERKDETDFLYILDFDGKFIKVGRSFDVNQRVKDLRTLSKTPIKRIHKLRIFTATHQEIYDYEQELHKELRERNFQYPVSWSTECFENDSLYILNKLLDNCEFQEVDLHSKY